MELAKLNRDLFGSYSWVLSHMNMFAVKMCISVCWGSRWLSSDQRFRFKRIRVRVSVPDKLDQSGMMEATTIEDSQ